MSKSKKLKIRPISTAYMSISILMFSSLGTAYAAGSAVSNSDNGSTLIAWIAAFSTAVAAILNAYANRQKVGKEMLDSATATQTAVFGMLQGQIQSLQNQVNSLQKDRDFYKEQLMSSQARSDELLKENSSLHKELTTLQAELRSFNTKI